MWWFVVGLLSSSGAFADDHAYEEVLLHPVDWVIHRPELDLAIEDAAGRAPYGASAVRVFAEGPDGVVRPLDAYLQEEGVVPEKYPNYRSFPVNHPGSVDGDLSGKAIYMSQCHGFIWYDSLNGFSTQRGNVWDTVEDFHNPEGANQFLLPYLENAGAAVFAAKERDMNPRMAIADNDADGYAESGSGFEDGPLGFKAKSSYSYGTDPFNNGTTRRFPAAGGGVASWVPDVPEDGWYGVYVSWDTDAGNADDAHYRFTHPGGTFDRYFDQTVHGSTWQYIERLWLTAGESLTVELIGDSSQANRMLSADAVRIGGGMGDVSRNGGKTGEARWEEGAILYTQFNGAPSSVYDPYGDGDGSDPSSRSKWAAWEHPQGEDAVYLSWHSNASGSTGGARGTVTYYAGGGSDAPGGVSYECSSGSTVTGSYSLAQSVQDELMGAFTSLWESDWPERYGSIGTGVATACFSEVDPRLNGEMPSALVELAFHDNETDASYLKHPRFRQDASRAMYRGIVNYFAERDGKTPHFLPEPPQGLALVHNQDGDLSLSWSRGPVGAPYGDAPSEYLVSTSPDGRAWSEAFAVSATETIVDAQVGETVFVRVVAANAGGVSFPSEVVGATRSPDGVASVLVVAAFDRMDRGLLQDISKGGSLGTIVRMDLRHMNAGDIVVPHGVAVAGAGWAFDAISDERLGDVDLLDYAVVVWATGEESTVDETISTSQQVALKAYYLGGGALWVSGAELLWDLDFKGTTSDKSFAADVLGAGMASDDAGTDRASGTGALGAIGTFGFGLDQGGPYPVEWPDSLSSTRDPLVQYNGGGVAAVLGDGVATFGFPFDAIADDEVRTEIARLILPLLAPNHDPPDLPDPEEDPEDPEDPSDPGDPGDPADPGDGEPGYPRIDGDDIGGCSCTTGTRPGVVWGALGALLVVFARRRNVALT